MDFNNDGTLDLISGDTDGKVWLFRNIGTNRNPVLAKGARIRAAGKEIFGRKDIYKKVGERYEIDRVIPGSHGLAEIYSKIHMADWTGDGLADLLIGHSQTIIIYKNTGTRSEPRFEAPEQVDCPDEHFPMRPSPYVVDWDGDGKRDLLVGSETSKVYYFRNVGSDAAPKLSKGVTLTLKGDGYDKGYRCRLGVSDWNNDGKLDLLVGNFYSSRDVREPKHGGNIWLFLRK